MEGGGDGADAMPRRGWKASGDARRRHDGTKCRCAAPPPLTAVTATSHGNNADGFILRFKLCLISTLPTTGLPTQVKPPRRPATRPPAPPPEQSTQLVLCPPPTTIRAARRPSTRRRAAPASHSASPARSGSRRIGGSYRKLAGLMATWLTPPADTTWVASSSSPSSRGGRDRTMPLVQLEVGRAQEAAEEDAAPDGERGGGWVGRGRGHCKAWARRRGRGSWRSDTLSSIRS